MKKFFTLINYIFLKKIVILSLSHELKFTDLKHKNLIKQKHKAKVKMGLSSCGISPISAPKEKKKQSFETNSNDGPGLPISLYTA